MKRSFLVALLPVVVGLGAYWLWWERQQEAFRAELTELLGQAPRQVRGFPYRLQADLGEVRLREEGGASVIGVAASDLTLERQPWRSGLTVAGAREPRLMVAALPVGGARLDIEAASGRASVRSDEGGLQRLSATFEDARLWLGLFSAMGRAQALEVHVRDAPPGPEGPGATGPAQAQVAVRAQGFRLDGGEPLALEAALEVTGDAPLASVAGWRQGGTVELRRLTLADDESTVAEVEATAVPRADGRLMLAGTVSTVCPATAAAAFAGRPGPAREFRARRAVSLPFSGVAGSVELKVPESVLGLPVRGQEAPCPRLRG